MVYVVLLFYIVHKCLYSVKKQKKSKKTATKIDYGLQATVMTVVALSPGLKSGECI